MTSRVAKSIRRSVLYLTLGRRVLVSTSLAVIVTAAARAQGAPAVSPAEARRAIQAGYAEWANARITLDVNTIQRMLAPDFYIQLPDQKLTRQDFIDRVRTNKVTRFDESVLTVEPKGNDWSVYVFVKGEVETKDKDGKTSTAYRALVSRDAWRQINDNQWVLLSSELLGQERWTERPPIANW